MLFRSPSPETYQDIPQEIIDAVDYVVEPWVEKDATGMASQIIKVGLRGEIAIIRQ